MAAAIGDGNKTAKTRKSDGRVFSGNHIKRAVCHEFVVKERNFDIVAGLFKDESQTPIDIDRPVTQDRAEI